VLRFNNYHTSIEVEEILGAFAKLRKGTIGFIMSVRMEQLCSDWADFHEI